MITIKRENITQTHSSIFKPNRDTDLKLELALHVEKGPFHLSE